jgi:tRNA (cytidine/uridine-2'-O-)-methyltransferase
MHVKTITHAVAFGHGDRLGGHIYGCGFPVIFRSTQPGWKPTPKRPQAIAPVEVSIQYRKRIGNRWQNLMPLKVVLYEPEIPPNTGNIIRLCANTGAELHLIEPLGFSLDHTKLKRAGLDYHEWADTRRHANLDLCLENCLKHEAGTVWAFSTRARRQYSDARFAENDILLFGPETRGLPDSVLTALPEPQRLRLPMLVHSRSLNLANAVAVAVYEAWRQQAFTGGQ